MKLMLIWGLIWAPFSKSKIPHLASNSSLWFFLSVFLSKSSWSGLTASCCLWFWQGTSSELQFLVTQSQSQQAGNEVKVVASTTGDAVRETELCWGGRRAHHPTHWGFGHSKPPTNLGVKSLKLVPDCKNYSKARKNNNLWKVFTRHRYSAQNFSEITVIIKINNHNGGFLFHNFLPFYRLLRNPKWCRKCNGILCGHGLTLNNILDALWEHGQKYNFKYI